MKNTKFNSHDVKSCCEKKLKIEFRATKEFNGWYLLNDKKVVRITVPQGRKFLPPKTYKSMANQLKLDTHQFDNLLECPLDKKGFDSILIKKLSNVK